MPESFGLLNSMLSSSVEDAVKYDFCHLIPYVKGINGFGLEMTNGSEWVKRELAKNLVIKSLKPKEMKFNLFIRSRKFPLKTRVELVVATENELIPVFPKLNLDSRDWKLEIVGKVVLLEEHLGREISRALVYLIYKMEWIKLQIHQKEKQTFIQLASKMWEREKNSKCELCEHRYACSILPGWI